MRDDIRKFDAAALAETVRDQLADQFCRINGFLGRPPKLVWGSQSKEETVATMQLVKAAGEAGLEVTDDGIAKLSERSGIGLQRKAAPAGPSPFSVVLAGGEQADPSQDLRALRAAAMRAVLESRSHAEAAARLQALVPADPSGRITALIADTLRNAAGLATAAEGSG